MRYLDVAAALRASLAVQRYPVSEIVPPGLFAHRVVERRPHYARRNTVDPNVLAGVITREGPSQLDQRRLDHLVGDRAGTAA